MLPIEISQKVYTGIYTRYLGADFEDVQVFRRVFYSEATDKDKEIFAVYTDDQVIKPDSDYLIFGYGDIQSHFFQYMKRVRYVHIVELIPSGIYYQNSGAICIYGKVRGMVCYKFNFSCNDIFKRKNTYINFLERVGCDFRSILIEKIALHTHNIRLLDNILRYKKLTYWNYSEEEFDSLKKVVIKSIKITNFYKSSLEEDINKTDNLKELVDFIKKNIKKIETQELLYNRNDNVEIRYPVNMVGTNVSLFLYEDGCFNSALPFWFQFNNYKQATQVIAEKFFNAIEVNESGRISNSMKMMKYVYGNEKQKDCVKREGFIDTTTEEYGLYFPLLMTFRQSVELAYKLIYVNEILKKQNITDAQVLEKNYINKVSTHNLLDILDLIKVFIDPDIFDYLWQLSSFIYYNEGTDPSFSRYIVNSKLEFDKVGEITLYYGDLYHYINEFYQIIGLVFDKMEFGFAIN